MIYLKNKNNTYHNAIKGNLLMLNQTHTLTLVKKSIMKILNLQLVMLLEYPNIKVFYKRLHYNLV